MNSLRTAIVSARLGYRALFAWNTPALFVTSLLLTPALQTLFFIVLGDASGYADAQFFITGNAVQATAAAGVGGMVSVIADERRFATLSAVLAAPGSTMAVFVGRLVPGVLAGIVVSLVISALGFSLTGLPFAAGEIGSYVVAVLVAAISCSTLGLALSAFGLVYRDIYQLATGVYLLMLVTSGANIAWTDLPPPLRFIGALLPAGHGIQAVRSIEHSELNSFGLHIGFEVAVSALWLAVALALVRVFEHRARSTASIDLS